jgi:nucleotide-binding universal stress UspA family protein
VAGTIVVGYDGTEGAQAALAAAIELGRDLAASLVVVFGYSPGLAERQVADHRQALHELADRETAKGVETAKAAGLDAVAAAVGERPAEALVHVADEHDARMIVVGSYGERPITGAILGSTPHRLVHLSERPVLVVRA